MVEHQSQFPKRPEFGPIWLTLRSRALEVEGSSKWRELDPQEYQIMHLLIHAQGERVLTSTIIEHLYRYQLAKVNEMYREGRNLIQLRILSIRRKLGDLTKDVTIKGDRDFGYYLEIRRGSSEQR